MVAAIDAVPEGLDQAPLAVWSDPWLEPVPDLAEVLVAADAGRRWRLPRINGASPPSTWAADAGPFTLTEYERRVESAEPGRARPPMEGEVPYSGFAVAAAGDADELTNAWPPEPERIAVVEGALAFRYDDPAAHGREELDPFVPETAGLLVDVGCGHGLFGSRHRRDGRIVVGIEPDRELARIAAGRLDLVLAADATVGLNALRGPLDCIVFADVLEHLADPGPALAAAAKALTPNGRVIASLPNSAWAPVLRDLTAGRWDPTLAGVQARDHLSPMTPRSFSRLAADCGLEVETRIRMPVRLPWRTRLWARWAALTAGGRLEDLLAVQWLDVLRRKP